MRPHDLVIKMPDSWMMDEASRGKDRPKVRLVHIIIQDSKSLRPIGGSFLEAAAVKRTRKQNIYLRLLLLDDGILLISSVLRLVVRKKVLTLWPRTDDQEDRIPSMCFL